MMTHDEILAIIQADKDGKQLEEPIAGLWGPCCLREALRAIAGGKHIRLKPEPLECWCNYYAKYVSSYLTEVSARENADVTVIRTAVHMREVPATNGEGA